ncbi:MAG: hypothetical protein RR054_03780 [Clostridia bacterium]
MIEKLLKIAYQKAVGSKSREITEEYTADNDGNMVLYKKKIVTKSPQPDLAALKFLIEGNFGEDYSQMTDEQLTIEKSRLLKLLQTESTEK